MRRRRKAGTALALGTATAVLVGGAAAALGGASTATLGSGGASVATCDADGFTVVHVLSGPNVSDVTIGDIHADCAGGDLVITVTDAGGAVIGVGGPSVVPGGGGSIGIALSPRPKQTDIGQHRMVVVGP